MILSLAFSAVLLVTTSLWISRAFVADPGLRKATVNRQSPGPRWPYTPTRSATAVAAGQRHMAFLPAILSDPFSVRGLSFVPTPTSPSQPTPRPTREPTLTPEPLNLRTDLPALSLRDWPRPVGDNGRCMHFLPVAYYEGVDLDLQIGRLKELGVKWALVIYGDEIQLERLALRFRDAGIMVVWRKGLNADQRYFGWGRDVELLQRLGLPPYMQLYNEPSLSAEWGKGEPDFDKFRDNILQAARDVYNAGGYVGLQFVSDEWLRLTLRAIKERKGEAIFGRMFFVPHPYGLNHPPNYTEDPDGVLGFRHYAQILQEEIGFVPPMIAGEGGWKFNASDDRRFPRIDDALHRDYHVEVFNWFRTGKLSDGTDLPDYLFAFCPWLLSAKLDDSAWYDSFAGPRTATIEAVKAIPPFVRRFSWD
ncbi:MAG: hypothetical protein RML36_10615 [Anaerolineae bacterium]|nr:hypothetical protein [Anaerolineae bacterium]